METTTLEKDITVFYITAESYPEGILAAHQKLHALVPSSNARKYFGLSRPEKENGIVYRAAAEELVDGEAEKLKCKTLLVKKGKYISLTVNDYLKDVKAIERSFEKLLSNSDIDPQGYCVEWYFTERDVKCMVRLNQ